MNIEITSLSNEAVLKLERTIRLASKDILTKSEAAELLGCSEKHFDKVRKQLLIPQYGTSGLTWFSKSEIETKIKKGK